MELHSCVGRCLHPEKHDTMSQCAMQELELYFCAIENADNDAIKDFFFDNNSDFNANSLKMPSGEQGKEHLKDGATLPAPRF